MKKLKKNFYCGDEVDYGYLPEEIQPEQIWNAEKKEGIKKLIQKHKLTTMMEQDEQLGLYQETKCHCGLELDCKDCSQSLEDCTCIEDTIDMKQSTKDRILSETSEEIKQRVRDTANRLVMKQETLEESAERLYPIIETNDYMDWYDKNYDIRNSFIEGAKWQQERSYSKGEVINLLYIRSMCQEHYESDAEIREWFNKFKKK